MRLATETCFESIESGVRRERPAVLFLDSVQTLYSAEHPSPPGSVSQLRLVSQKLLVLAKETNTCVVMSGHVTKGSRRRRSPKRSLAVHEVMQA